MKRRMPPLRKLDLSRDLTVTARLHRPKKSVTTMKFETPKFTESFFVDTLAVKTAEQTDAYLDELCEPMKPTRSFFALREGEKPRRKKKS